MTKDFNDMSISEMEHAIGQLHVEIVRKQHQLAAMTALYNAHMDSRDKQRRASAAPARQISDEEWSRQQSIARGDIPWTPPHQ